jgi:hypothetical protein
MKKTEHKIFSVTLIVFVIILLIGIVASRAHAEEVTCYWAQCTTNEGKLTGCWNYDNGSREKMLKYAVELANKSGNLFFAECSENGKPTAIDWNRKITGVPFPH